MYRDISNITNLKKLPGKYVPQQLMKLVRVPYIIQKVKKSRVPKYYLV